VAAADITVTGSGRATAVQVGPAVSKLAITQVLRRATVAPAVVATAAVAAATVPVGTVAIVTVTIAAAGRWIAVATAVVGWAATVTTAVAVPWLAAVGVGLVAAGPPLTGVVGCLISSGCPSELARPVAADAAAIALPRRRRPVRKL